MRKFYQTHWHGIEFTSFAKLDASKMADAEFYNSFYQKFFQLYSQPRELAADWIKEKSEIAEFIKHYIDNTMSVLSIGCGLGVIEQYLLDAGISNINVQEVSALPLRWLKSTARLKDIYIGYFPECLPANNYYDFIYLAAVDYCFNKRQLVDLLKSVRGRLKANGRCMIVSVTYDNQGIVTKFKDKVKAILHYLGLRQLGQFWGYLRNRRDYQQAMKQAGFSQIEDGKHNNFYYISGNR